MGKFIPCCIGYLSLNWFSLLRQWLSREPGRGRKMESAEDRLAPLLLSGENGRFRVIEDSAAAAPIAIAALVINSRLLSSRAVFSDPAVMAPS